MPYYPAGTPTLFQRWNNVDFQRWNNVEKCLILWLNWRQISTLNQRRVSTLKQRQISTLKQRQVLKNIKLYFKCSSMTHTLVDLIRTCRRKQDDRKFRSSIAIYSHWISHWFVYVFHIICLSNKLFFKVILNCQFIQLDLRTLVLISQSPHFIIIRINHIWKCF